MDQWRTNTFAPPKCWDLDGAGAFDEASRDVELDDVAGAVRISDSPAQHVDWLLEYAAMGFDEIYLHHVGQNHDRYLDVFASEVLPQLKKDGQSA